MSISIGNELKDSFKPTSKWVDSNIHWLADIEEFYRERALIEQDYASKLKVLTKKYFDKKTKVLTSLSVGDEPKITPGSLESASLVLWTDVLTQTENIAQEKNSLANEFTTKVCANLSSLRNKSDRISKRIENINEFLVNDKKKTEDDVNKLKRNYDLLCQLAENVRVKLEKSPLLEKYKAKFHEKEVDMNNGKNEYLININIANRLKDKYYYQDVPEITDYLQELNELRVGILNKLLKNASIIERNSNDRVKEKLHAIDSTIDQNNPTLDTTMYVKHNLTDGWREPQDFIFVPCEFWHDDESLIVREPELTTLKKILNQQLQVYSKYEDMVSNTKQQLEEATVERKLANAPDQLTLKFDGVLGKSLQILEQFMKDDSMRVQSEVKIEVIQNFAGDKDLTFVEVKEKKKSRFGFLGGKSSSGGATGHASSRGDGDDSSLHTTKSGRSHINTSGGIFNLRKNRSRTSSVSTNNASGPIGKALYDYSAAGDDEISISLGDLMDVLELDDGSGWTSVQLNGSKGLVPTSYLEITQQQQQNSASSIGGGDTPKRGPSVAPKRGAKRVQYVEAIYDYAADGADELSLTAGDRIILIQDDTDGSGWTEGEVNGERGLFPTSYVKKV